MRHYVRITGYLRQYSGYFPYRLLGFVASSYFILMLLQLLRAWGHHIIAGEKDEVQIGFTATHWLSRYADNHLVMEGFFQPIKA